MIDQYCSPVVVGCVLSKVVVGCVPSKVVEGEEESVRSVWGGCQAGGEVVILGKE